jgi:hypothetical protein
MKVSSPTPHLPKRRRGVCVGAWGSMGWRFMCGWVGGVRVGGRRVRFGLGWGLGPGGWSRGLAPRGWGGVRWGEVRRGWGLGRGRTCRWPCRSPAIGRGRTAPAPEQGTCACLVRLRQPRLRRKVRAGLCRAHGTCARRHADARGGRVQCGRTGPLEGGGVGWAGGAGRAGGA